MIAEPDMFEDVKKELVDIFLTIQEELDNQNFSNILEDTESISREDENEEDEDEEDHKEGKPESFIDNPHKIHFKNSESSRERVNSQTDSKSPSSNIEKPILTDNILDHSDLNSDNNTFHFGDISLSGTTCTLAFQINKRLIVAYVGDSYA
mmetsp:Transcript_25427/g.22586  ORF Transcript_25427/g.22586 Transcript_25427/m.22586 type:complete len:151 (+) Transcript_25427:598-1050(+)